MLEITAFKSETSHTKANNECVEHITCMGELLVDKNEGLVHLNIKKSETHSMLYRHYNSLLTRKFIYILTEAYPLHYFCLKSNTHYFSSLLRGYSSKYHIFQGCVILYIRLFR